MDGYGDELVKSVPISQLRASVTAKNFPYCTFCLAILVCTCHMFTLLGNLQMASSLQVLGASTVGWSSVGVDLSQSLQGELNEIMENVTAQLTDAINHTMYVQGMLDTVVGIQGHAVDAVVSKNATTALMLLQMHGMVDAVPDGLPGMITQSVNAVLDTLMSKILEGLHTLMVKLKPALVTVGELITKFGEKVQTMLEHFSVTMDRVQKIFDQVMSNMASKGANGAALEHETFNLFDVSNSGFITAQDLKNTGRIYSIPALQGDVSDQLVAKYDRDNSGHLSRQEFKLLVHDPSIPNCMSVVLRSFAKSLSQVAGQVGGGKFRGEVAEDVADYLELMAQKNMTKVSWISDALTNATLPLEFTSDIIAYLALKLDNPNALPAVVTGKVVVAEMMRLNPQQTSKAVDLLSNVTYWIEEGFSASDHAEVVKRVTAWVTQPQKPAANMSLEQTFHHQEALELLGQGGLHKASTMTMERKLLNVMPDIAHKLAKQRMRAHLESMEEKRRLHYDALYSTETSQQLLLQLLGGEPALRAAASSPAQQMVKTGVAAHPETLIFAQWLSWNASHTADRFQNMSFAYQKTSSNAIDSFGAQIQGMVKKVQGFVNVMKQYSTPDNIQAIEDTVEKYAAEASADVLKVIKEKVGSVVADAVPALEAGLHTAVQETSMKLGDKIATALAGPLASSLAPTISKILEELVGNQTATQLGGQIGAILSGELANVTGPLLGKEIADLLDKLVDKGLSGATDGLSNLPFMSLQVEPVHSQALQASDEVLLAALRQGLGSALLQAQEVVKRGSRAGSTRDLEENQPMLSGSWEQMVDMLKSLTNVVPQATKALTSARKEVMMLAKNLDSVFTSFGHAGAPLFDNVSALWRTVFTLYFCIIIPFPLALLFYACWAGGYFVGPGVPEDKSRFLDNPETKTFRQKCMGCYFSCCYCLCGCHDSPVKAQLCFWSVCILMQIVVLFLFIISLVFCLVTVVKIFLASGCAQIYLLGDQSVCGTTLTHLRIFLTSFIPGVPTPDFAAHCVNNELLTCNLIGAKMKTSGLLVACGSFLAAVFSFQLLVDSATMHERAVIRFRIEKQIRETAKDVQNSSIGGSR